MLVCHTLQLSLHTRVTSNKSTIFRPDAEKKGEVREEGEEDSGHNISRIGILTSSSLEATINKASSVAACIFGLRLPV